MDCDTNWGLGLDSAVNYTAIAWNTFVGEMVKYSTGKFVRKNYSFHIYCISGRTKVISGSFHTLDA